MNKQLMWVGSVALALIAILGLGVLFISRGTENNAQAQTTPVNGADGYSGISVAGSGIVLVKPDVIRLTIGAETRATTVSEAQKQSADKIQKITDALKAAGVKAEDIRTASYNIYPDYLYQQNQSPQLRGYIVNTQLAIVVRDITKAGSVIDVAGTSGATQIGSISFGLDNNAEALKQARTAAMEDARKKADQLAIGGKVTVGSVIKIVEQSQNVPPTPLRAVPQNGAGAIAAPADAAASTNLESGQYQVVVSVQVTYAIK